MVGETELTRQYTSGALEAGKFKVVAVAAAATGSSLNEYDSLDLPASAVTKDEVTVVLKAKEGTGYADVPFKIAKTSSGGGTEQPETKTAPKVDKITENASDGIYEVSFKTEKLQDTRNYLAAITEVTVGGVPYEASENTPKSGSKQFRSKSQWLDLRVLQLGSGGFATDGKATEIVVKATGYKDLVINYGTDATPTEPATKPAPKGTVAKENEYYQVSFAGDDAFEYIKAIKSVKVGDVSYVLSDEYTPTNNQFAKGSTITPVLKLGSAGFTGDGDITITITADGYAENTVTYTIPSSGSDKDDTETGKDYPTDTAKLEKIKEPFSDTYYRLSFTVEDVNTLDVYLKALKEVSVNDSQVTLGYGLYSSNQCKVSSDNGTRLYIDFTEDVFTVGKEAKIIIKADGYKTLTLKLTPTAK